MSLPSQLGAAGALARFWLRSYAADYIALGIIAAGWLLTQLLMLPFHRMFYLDDMTLQYPFAEVERVPVCSVVSHIFRPHALDCAYPLGCYYPSRDT